MLLVIGGLVVEVNPTEIPAGSSPLCCDMDFTVASGRTRDGLENVYVYNGADEILNAGSGVNIIEPGGTPWQNPTNIELNSPPSYASATLNEATPITPGIFSFESDVGATGAAAGPVSITGSGNGYVLFIDAAFINTPIPPNDPGWTSIANFNGFNVSGRNASGPLTATVTPTGYLAGWTAMLAFFTGGLSPTPVQHIVPTGFSGPTGTGTFPGNQTAGNINIGVIQGVFNNPFSTPSITDSNGNVYTLVAVAQNGTAPCSYIQLFATGPIVGGANTVTYHIGSGAFNCNFATVIEMPAATFAGAAGLSDILEVSGYGFSIPLSSQVLGVQLELRGKQSVDTSDTIVVVTPINGGSSFPTQLPTSQGSAFIGGPNEFIGVTSLTPPQVNSNSFGFDIQGFSATTGAVIDLSAAEVTVWYTPPDVENFNFVGTFAQTDGTTLSIALDNTGVLWQEDIVVTPNELTPFYTAIEPNTFAIGVTQDDRFFMAFSNRQAGTDMPRGYNGQWLDRLSQVGPGVAPSFSATSTSYTILSITQPPAVTNASPSVPIHTLIWSTGAGTKGKAGNVLTVEYTPSPANPPDPNIYVGGGVVLSGFETFSYTPGDPNGSYIVVSVQVVDTGSGPRNSFSVVNPTTARGSPGMAIVGSAYQSSLATLTLVSPAPGVQVGTQILIAGATPAAWNSTWTILNALNAAQLTINTTQLSGNVATYNYTLISGTAPAAGQQVTVTGTTNGDGIFNVVNAIISAASPGQFSLEIDAPDVTAAAESGQGIVNGTIFTFDPGPTFVGPTPTTPTSPFIIGNDTTGGTIVQQGQLGAGPRKGVVMFLTRNGLLTAPSPFQNFTVNSGASSLTATGIPIGPPNVIARVIAFTGANGGFYFWLPQSVSVISNGQTIVYSATIIPDNSTTSATFNLTDAVLLNGLSIDTAGSNNFAQIELGSSIGVTSYAGRIFAWGENNKIQNMLNLSFDGGYQLLNESTPIAPAGWTVDQNFGPGGVLQNSPLFGNSYYIKNTTGSTQAKLGMITQSAFQDQLGTPIINVQTEYSVRVTARCPSGVQTGSLVVDLFSPSFGNAYGSFSIPFSSMTDTMAIFTGTLLTTAFATQVPNDLELRLYAANIPNGGDVEVDRIEPFDTAQPVLTTNLRASYFNNFEAFDGVTGNLGVGIQNQQPVRNTFSLFDNLYIVKTKSLYSTVDNGITEPYLWNIKEVSNKVGTPSIFGVDVGEGWALIAGEAGVYVFMGGAPVKISPELDGDPGLWQSINWKYGYTLWIRNDTNARKFFVGVPLATPNRWMPKFEANANPTEPNVVLVCNYKELMSAGALVSEGPLRQTYMGDLKTMALGRKWSAWSIQAHYADFIDREDTTDPLFYCGDTDTAKIYQQITGNFADDGDAMHCFYVTYPFPKPTEAQQMHMGLHELLAKFMSMTIIGEGMLRLTLFPNTLDSPYAEAQDPIPLGNPPPWGDTEHPLNIEGDRFFVGFEVLDPGEWFELSKVVMAIGENPWAPVRGVNM